jgi:hypothetical protein
MKAAGAKADLETFLAGRAQRVSGLKPAEGIASMCAFYREVRADDCDLATDGDMLLFQWGTYDWGRGPRFEVDITRQLIVGDGEDGDIWQLHLSFRYRPTDDLGALGRGNVWCQSPAELATFSAFVDKHPVLGALADGRDAEVTLEYEQAG